MAGAFAATTRLLYQGVTQVAHTVQKLRPLDCLRSERPHYAWLSLLLTVTLLLPLSLLPRLSAHFAPDAHFVRAAYAAPLPVEAACHNNGSGTTLVNYLDDLALQSCDSTTPATPTATATPPPSSVIVRAGGVAVIEGQTAVTVPLDLVGGTVAPAVGVLSIDIQYDTTVLKAVACTVSNSFDLLLCNLETPGLVQLAGVAAKGIRTDVRVADLGFALLPPANRTTQLTVQLDALADVDGTTMNATGQAGQISVTCRPGSDNCQTLFLPLVHR